MDTGRGCRIIIEWVVVFPELFERLFLLEEYARLAGGVDGEERAEKDHCQKGPDHPVEEGAKDPQVGVEGQEEVGDPGHGALLHGRDLRTLPHLKIWTAHHLLMLS